MINVVFVDDAHTFGGAQIALRNVIVSLMLSGNYRITLFSTRENISKVLVGDAAQKVNAFVIPSAKPLNIFSFFFGVLGVYRVLAPQLKDESSVWVMNLSGIEFCLSSLFLLKLKGRKSIAWLHNSRTFTDLLPGLVGFRRMLNQVRDKVADRFIFSKYQQIIVPSESERSFLSCRVNRIQNVCVVRNPIVSRVGLSDHHRMAEKCSIEPAGECGLRIYVVGRIEFSTKGQDKCVSISHALAARGVPAHFIFVGDGPDASALSCDFEHVGLAKSLTITGWKEDPYDQITADDIVLIASNFESGSLVAAESMLRGLRIVSSTLPVFKEILPGACIVNSENASDYAQRIISIRDTDLQLLRAMYQEMLNEFSPEAMEKKFSRVLGLQTGSLMKEASIECSSKQ